MKPPARCGTRAGYNAHRRKGEDPCEPCRSAMREYMRQPRNVARNRARSRAMRRLARLHPKDFRALYLEELARLGIPFVPADHEEA